MKQRDKAQTQTDSRDMGKEDTSKNYVAVLLTWADDIAARPEAEEVRVALLLSMACFIRKNGGRIADAVATFENERKRGLYGLTLAQWEFIKQQAGFTPFWHFEGDSLVVDFYSVYHESSLMAKIEGGRNGGLKSGEVRRQKAELQNKTKDASKDASKDALKDALNNKEINTTYGSISKDVPHAGARHVFDDGAATAAGGEDKATPEEVADVAAMWKSLRYPKEPQNAE